VGEAGIALGTKLGALAQSAAKALRVGSEHAFPAADVASMLDEIEHGYGIHDT
jgi:hypothetical protein